MSNVFECYLCGKYLSDGGYVLYISNNQKPGEEVQTEDGKKVNTIYLSLEGGEVHYFQDMILCYDCYSKFIQFVKNLRSEDIRKLIRIIVNFVVGKSI
ncbi:MAG: hypothetical protein QXL14_03120 [Candidatus Aenigmatarchaeota archaeon]